MNLIKTICIGILFSAAVFCQSKPAGGIKVVTPVTGYLKVYTAANDVYDDGMLRKKFSRYDVLTESGEKLFSVPSSYDFPGTVRLNEGKYVIIAEMYKGKKELLEITVEPGKTVEVTSGALKNPIL